MNANMDNTEILIAIGIGIVFLALVLCLLAKVFKALFAMLAFIFKPVFWIFGLFSHSKKTKPKDIVPHYKSLAEFASAIASDPTAIDSNLHAIFTSLRDEIGNVHDEIADEYEKALLAVPLESLEKIADATIKDKSKPMFASIGELAAAIEDKEAKLDSGIRAIFTEIYDYCDLFTCTSDHDEDLQEVTFDLEQALWPKGQTEAQSQATGRRQTKIEAAVKAKMKSSK